MALQATKVTQYADWGQLYINNTKTIATGAQIHNPAPKDPFNLLHLTRTT
jgi:hypothetical protein